MITIHEAGHYFGARLSHIDVEVFAIGWGKAIKKWYRNGIEYRLNIFILGGYCKLKGSDDLLRSIQRDDNTFTTIEKGSLFAAHPLKRIITYLAGPLQNLIFAFLIFIPFFMIGHTDFQDSSKILLTRDYPTIYQEIENSAYDGGIRSEDIILSINGEKLSSFQEIAQKINEYDGEGPLSVEIKRGSTISTQLITPTFDKENNRYLFGITNALTPTIDEVKSLTPESIASLATGDTIISVNGITTPYSMDVITQLLLNENSVEMVVKGIDGTLRNISYHPFIDENGNMTLNFSFKRNTSYIDGYPFFTSISHSFTHTITSIKETFYFLGQLFTGAFSLSDSLAGPIRISYIIGEMRTSGVRSFLQLLAMISISLGVANLIPLPGLDGGYILLSLIELLRNRTFSPKLYVRFQTLGVIILSILMIFVLFSDAKFLFS
jgi:regulator of sigma E protease